MPETQSVDEVVSNRPASRVGGGLNPRPVEEETVASTGGAARVLRSGIEEETHSGNRRGRAIKQSTEDLLAKFEKEGSDALAPHEEGDADEGESEGDETGDVGQEAAPTEDAAAESAAAGEGDAVEEGEGEEAAPDPAAELRAAQETLARRNKELLEELESAKKTPKRDRSERETALVAAESSYIDDSVASIRKFLSVVTGAAPDSKEVDAELAGLYTDLTARELGVALDENQRTLRDNARTRLLLARDKREKAEAEKKPDVDNSADAVAYGEATKLVDSVLSTKAQSGTSLADEYPMLMHLAQDLDGYAPGEVVARAIRQEIMAGILDPTGKQDVDLIRAVAPKIEKHYDAVAKKIEAARAKQTKPGTTTPSAKPKVANAPSQEQRQSTEARTLTNATASRAPATLPKTTKPKAPTTASKTRKDFPSEAAWKEHLLAKHFKS